MNISRRALSFASLSVLLLWLPASSGAVSSSILCQGLGNGLWGQWLDGTLPRTDATIDKVLKVKQDCPQLGGSMNRMVNDIKAAQQKIPDARRRLQDHCEQARAMGLTGHLPNEKPGLAQACK